MSSFAYSRKQQAQGYVVQSRLNQLSPSKTLIYSSMSALAIAILAILIPLLIPQKFEKISLKQSLEDIRIINKNSNSINDTTDLLEYQLRILDYMNEAGLTVQHLIYHKIGFVLTNHSKRNFVNYLYIYFNKNNQILQPGEQYYQSYTSVSVYGLKQSLNQDGQIQFKKLKLLQNKNNLTNFLTKKQTKYLHFSSNKEKYYSFKLFFAITYKQQKETSIPNLQQKGQLKIMSNSVHIQVIIFAANILFFVLLRKYRQQSRDKIGQIIIRAFMLYLLMIANPMYCLKITSLKNLGFLFQIYFDSLCLSVVISMQLGELKLQQVGLFNYKILLRSGLIFAALFTTSRNFFLANEEIIATNFNGNYLSGTILFILAFIFSFQTINSLQGRTDWQKQQSHQINRNGKKLTILFLPFSIYTIWTLVSSLNNDYEIQSGISSIEYVIIFNFEIWFILWLMSQRKIKVKQITSQRQLFNQKRPIFHKKYD